jgi:hypothetical protein
MVSAATLERAGVSTWIRSRRDLGSTLVQLLDGDRGRAQRAAAAPMLRADPAALVAHLASPSRESREEAGLATRWPERRAVNEYGSKSVVGADETVRDRRR